MWTPPSLHHQHRAFLLLLLLFSQFPGDGGRRLKGRGCSLPPSWHGVWFQSGVRPYVTVDPDGRISTKGRCVRSSGQKYVFKESDDCYRCLVLHQRAHNVLQYKETFGCSRRSDLSALCSEISGDAPLYWLFRADGHSVACPFFHHRHEGDDGGDGVDGLLLASSLSFSYDRGKGGCEWPLSAVRACTRASAVALHYQACPNVKGSEMMTEELECRAVWRDGSHRFLMGRVRRQRQQQQQQQQQQQRQHPHRHLGSDDDDDESRFRCFAFAFSNPTLPSEGMRMSRSADATCNGIYSPEEGPTTYVVARGESGVGCSFPGWLTTPPSSSSSSNSRHWRSRWRWWRSIGGEVAVRSASNSSQLLLFESTPPPPQQQQQQLKHHNRHHLSQGGGGGHVRSSSPSSSSSPLWSHYPAEEKGSPTWMTCHRQEEKKVGEQGTHRAVLFVSRGCESGYVCAEFTKRTEKVIFMRRGLVSRAADYACDADHFSAASKVMLLLQQEGNFSKRQRRKHKTPPYVFPGLYIAAPSDVGAAEYFFSDSVGSSAAPASSSSSLAAAVSKKREGDCPPEDGEDKKAFSLHFAFACDAADLMVRPAGSAAQRCRADRFAQDYTLLHEWTEDLPLNAEDVSTTPLQDSLSPFSSSSAPRLRYLIYKPSPPPSSSSSSSPFCVRLLLRGKEGNSTAASSSLVMTRLDRHCQEEEEEEEEREGDEGRLRRPRREMVLSLEGDCSRVSSATLTSTALFSSPFFSEGVPLLFIGLLNLSLFDVG